MIHLLLTMAMNLRATAHASDRAEVEALIAQAQISLAAADDTADYRASARALRTAIKAIEALYGLKLRGKQVGSILRGNDHDIIELWER